MNKQGNRDLNLAIAVIKLRTSLVIAVMGSRVLLLYGE